MNDCSKTEIYLSERNRMSKVNEVGICKIKCKDCPLGKEHNGKYVSCLVLELKHSETAIAIVQKWSDENPQKTFLTELLKNYPNVTLTESGVPNFCPWCLGLMNIDECRNGLTCIKCWNQPIEEVNK